MGKDRRRWRKLVKKLKRKRKRLEVALLRLGDESQPSVECNEVKDSEDVCEPRESDDDDDNVDSTFFLSHLEWEEREHQTELAIAMKNAETKRMAEIEAEKKRKIREEWEAKQKQQRILKEEKERVEKLAKEKQEAEFNEFLSFLSGDIETPPTKYLMPDVVTDDDMEVCHYFSRTAACRFYDRCTKPHPRPTLSTAILIPNFFSHFKLEQCVRDEYDTDLGLEYEDNELYKEFLEFYDDVIPELRKCGTVIQFKVCRNLEPHLRGNVYIQYETIRESIEAYRKFNGRFFNGKQHLHVFRNPTKEFVKADHDWKDVQRPGTIHSSLLPDQTTSSELVASKGHNKAYATTPAVTSRNEKKKNELTSTSQSEPNKAVDSAAGASDNHRSNRKHKVDKHPKSKSRKTQKSRSQSPSSKKHKKSKKSKKKRKRNVSVNSS